MTARRRKLTESTKFTYRRYKYNGKNYSVDELMEMAKVPCSKSRMYDRLRHLGVDVAVECEDFEALRRKKLSAMNSGKRSNTIPDIPPFDEDELWIKNMLTSLTAEGYTDEQANNELKKRWSMYGR